jgi:hypothetical protein
MTDASMSMTLIAAAATLEVISKSPPPPPPPSSSKKSSPCPKLILPALTQEVQDDLESVRGGSNSNSKPSIPLSITKRPEWADYPLKDIEGPPHPNDVLCGRGGGSNNHPGNESFRSLVNEVKLPYVNCSKLEKPLIARRVVEAVRNQTPPGRFLQRDGKTGLWNDIGDGRAREKTSQALREGAPVLRDLMVGTGGACPSEGAKLIKGAKKAKRQNALLDKMQVVSGGSGEKAKMIEVTMGTAFPTAVPSSDTSGPAQMIHEKRNSLPPLKRFMSTSSSTASSQISSWQQQFNQQHLQQQQRQPPIVRNDVSSYHHASNNNIMLNAFSALLPQTHRRESMDSMYPANHSQSYQQHVPLETVRRLLLGQLDPVQLALQILSPEDASVVARRHFVAESHNAINAMRSSVIGGGSGDSIAPPVDTQTATRPLPLYHLVSEGSSASTDSSKRLTPTSQGGDDASSDDSSRMSNTQRAKSVLPKKKRKFVED